MPTLASRNDWPPEIPISTNHVPVDIEAYHLLEAVELVHPPHDQSAHIVDRQRSVVVAVPGQQTPRAGHMVWYNPWHSQSSFRMPSCPRAPTEHNANGHRVQAGAGLPMGHLRTPGLL
ncbi:hypothetical protein ES708_23592 [subsurface metagenome]